MAASFMAFHVMVLLSAWATPCALNISSTFRVEAPGRSSKVVVVVVHFWVFLELSLYILDFFWGNFSPADRAPFFLRHFELNVAAKLILFPDSVHEPVPVDADQVEPVETLVHSHQVFSVSELLLLVVVFLTELIETHRTSAVQSVIVMSEDFPRFLVQVIDETSIVSVFLLLVC